MKNNEHTSDEDAIHDYSTRDESKRPHPWFVNSSRSEMFPNKKQAVQDRVGGLGKSNVGGLPLWKSSSVFQSVSNQNMDRFLGAEMPPRPLLFDDRDRIEGSRLVSNGVEVAGSCFRGDGVRKISVRSQRKLESSSIQARSWENESSFINFALAGYPCGNEDSLMVVLALFPMWLETINLMFRIDPIGTSDMVNGQETESSQTNSGVVSEQQVFKPSLETLPKKKSEAKSSKKEASTSFPTNVRSLISTGMLDGVPVKYGSLLRDVKPKYLSAKLHNGLKLWSFPLALKQYINRSFEESSMDQVIYADVKPAISQRIIPSGTVELHRIYGKEEDSF